MLAIIDEYCLQAVFLSGRPRVATCAGVTRAAQELARVFGWQQDLICAKIWKGCCRVGLHCRMLHTSDRLGLTEESIWVCPVEEVGPMRWWAV